MIKLWMLIEKTGIIGNDGENTCFDINKKNIERIDNE